MYEGIIVRAFARRNETLKILQMGAIRRQPLIVGVNHQDSDRGRQGCLISPVPSITRPYGLTTQTGIITPKTN